jgi:hypothetical protein
MNAYISNISHYGDLLAIPFFFALVVYFWGIKERTQFENILLLFCVGALVCDVAFTLQFFSR